MAAGPDLVHLDMADLYDKYATVCDVFFTHFGQDARISLEQLVSIYAKLDGNITRSEIEDLWAQIDKDASGDISCEELLQHLFNFDGLAERMCEDFEGLTKSDVYCRVRPIGADGHTMGEAVEKQLDGWSDDSIFVKDRHDRTEYKFPKKVLGPEATQEEAYRTIMTDTVHGWLHNAMHVMLIAYGQTGTGKTHTMFGPKESLTSADVHPDWGLFPRAAHEALETLRRVEQMTEIHGGFAWSLRAHGIEFYFGQAFDLIHGKRPIEFDPQGLPLGANFVEIRSVSDLVPFLDMVNANRTMSGTKMNAGSSRSHCALILSLANVHVEKSNTKDGIYGKVSLTLLDMAGSERPDKTGAERIGVAQMSTLMSNPGKLTKKQKQGMEGGVINFELFGVRSAIAEAFEANLRKKKYKMSASHPPMMKMLGRCFLGQCWMNAIVCLSQSPQNGWETWFSCDYGEALAKLQAPLRKIKMQQVDKARKDLAASAAKAKKVFEKDSGSKFRTFREAMAKHAADELALFDSLFNSLQKD